MNFGKAIEQMEKGVPVARAGWPPQLNMSIQIQAPTEVSKMTQPYFYISIGDQKYPWFPSMDELLAKDWNVVNKSNLIIPPSAARAT